jgi:V-type H+-transporting ATPase subunit d
MYSMPELTFNIDHGYLEGLVRGFKAGILTQSDYLNLVQCETLDGKNHIVSRACYDFFFIPRLL